MNAAKIVLLSALIAAAIASSWQWHRHDVRRQETVRLRAENERLRIVTKAAPGNRQHGATSPGNAPRAAGETPELTRAATGATPERALSTANYRNEGQATPMAAMQTLAWACDHADMALMEQLLVFDADAREKAQRIFEMRRAKLPAQWTTIQSMAAALYLADGIERPYPVASVLSVAKFEELRPGRVMLHLPGSNGDRYEFERTADGWKLVVTMAVVDDYIRQSAKDASSR